MMRRAAIAIFALLGGTAPAMAQNPGQDASKFEPTEHLQFGGYELFCGHFGDPKAEKCELRRTEILSPRPRFRAMVIYWRFDRDGLRITVDAERTTRWAGGGIKVDGALTIAFDRCVLGRCVVDDAEARQLARLIGQANSLSIALIDIAEAKELDWELADLKEGLSRLAELRRAKGLP